MSQEKIIFRQFGHSYHLQIETARDLEHALALDEALWVATGAPVTSMNTDQVFLDYLDTDNNGRLLCFEIKNGIKWLLEHLANRSGIDSKSEELQLDWINTETESGGVMIVSCRKMLRELGNPDGTSITLTQVRRIRSTVESNSASHTGIATPDKATDPKIKQFIIDIIDTLGGVSADAETKGVSTAQLDEFINEAEAMITWYKESVIPKGQRTTKLMSLGEKTHSAFQSYIVLRDKIDQYYAQCESIAFDPRTTDLMMPSTKDMRPEDIAEIKKLQDFMERSPIAQPDARQVLRFSEQINPFYDSALQRFRVEVMIPIFDQPMKNLNKSDWLKIKETFSEYQKWHDGKKGVSVESLGLEKLHIYTDPRFREETANLINASSNNALILGNIHIVEQLILYQANMINLLNNFVSFPDLYHPDARALFEMGTLIIDGRHLNFSVKVTDLKQHCAVAKTSNIFIVYAEILHEDSSSNYLVAVPVTSGTKGNLCVGKRGVFKDLDNKIRDARIVEIIENPISICETIAAPFHRLGKLITGKIEAITSSAEKKLDATASQIAPPGSTPPHQQAAPQGGGLMAGGLIMGGGVAIAAITSSITFFLKTIATMSPMKTVLGILIAVLAVIAPATVIAVLKLRRRDLSSILEGIGWAINARMRLTFAQGRVFTLTPPLPRDAMVKGGTRWWFWLTLAITLLLTAAACLAEEDWKRDAAIGLNLTSGNSDTSLFNTDLTVEKKWDAHELKMETQFAYGKTEKETTEENGSANIQYNRILTDRVYLYFNTDAAYDRISLLDSRYITGPGLGFYLIKNDKINFTLEAGGSYMRQRLNTPPTTNSVDSTDRRDENMNWRVMQKMEIIPAETSKIWESVEYLPNVDDHNIYLMNAQAGTEAAINAHFSLRFVIEDKYDSEPAPGIKNNDVIIKSAIVCKL